MKSRKLAILALLVLLLLLSIGTWFGMKWLSEDSIPTESPANSSNLTANSNASVPPTTQPADAGLPPIKLGIIVSLKNAQAAGPKGAPYGFNIETRIMPDLHAPDIDFYPVVESGTESNAALRAQIDRLFPGKTVIDGGNPIALKTLDAIAAGEIWDADRGLISSIHQAITNGVGLLTTGGVGASSPGFGSNSLLNLGGNSPCAEIAGFERADFVSSGVDIPCEVVAANPVLGDLWNKGPVFLRARGPLGTLRQFRSPRESLRHVQNGRIYRTERAVFYPIYLSHLGKGKIVGIQFAAYRVGTPITPVERSRLFVRSIHWLANRPMQ